MSINQLVSYVILFFVLIVPLHTNAETVLRIGSDISVEENQVVEGDYYVSVGPFGKTVMSGVVKEDMYAMGASVVINGEVQNDVSILAGVSQVHASVTDDVRIFAGEVTIAEDVGGDVFVLAESLSILSTAHIGGDVFFFGGTLSIEGDVEGSVFGKAQSVYIDASVGKDVDMTATASMSLGDTALIEGSVRYKSFTALARGQGAVIIGDIQKQAVATGSSQEKLRQALVPVFVVLFTTLSLYLLIKREYIYVVDSIERQFVRNFFIGAAVLFLGPFAALLLMVTVLGLFVGILTFCVVLLLYVLGIALLSVVLGAFTIKLFTGKLRVTLVAIVVGTILTQLLLLIPLVGVLTLMVVLAVTVGACTQRFYTALSS